VAIHRNSWVSEAARVVRRGAWVASYVIGQAGRRIARDPRPWVLAYHGVIASRRHPVLDRFAVTADVFQDHLRQLGRFVDFTDSTHLLRPSGGGRPKVLVTFDDAFESVYINARPILRELGIPAVVSAVASLIDTGHTIWSLEIDVLLMYAGNRAIEIPMPTGERRTWPLGSPAERESARLAARRAAYAGGGDFPLRLTADLTAQVGAERLDEALRDLRHLRIMTSAQLRDLAHDGFEIGAHGHHHLDLASLPGPLLEQETAGARDALRAKLGGVAPNVFCIPYGSASPDVSAAIRAAGFTLCLTTDPGRVGDDRWALPRFDGAVSTAELFGAVARAS
jgi:peptidoglycan/xylan/chitin deacetylase (PgdA/CDA1 family)